MHCRPWHNTKVLVVGWIGEGLKNRENTITYHHPPQKKYIDRFNIKQFSKNHRQVFCFWNFWRFEKRSKTPKKSSLPTTHPAVWESSTSFEWLVEALGMWLFWGSTKPLGTRPHKRNLTFFANIGIVSSQGFRHAPSFHVHRQKKTSFPNVCRKV